MEQISQAMRVFFDPEGLLVGFVLVLLTLLTIRILYGRKEEATDEPTYDLFLETMIGRVFTGCEFQPTAGKRTLPDYIDMDAILTEPKLLEGISSRIVKALEKYPSAKICFSEKDSGPVGVLSIAGLIASKSGKPVSIIRPRRNVEKMTVKGEPIKDGDQIVLIQDVLTTAFQVLQVIRTVEKIGASVIAVVACVDREENKDADVIKRNIEFISVSTMTEINNYINKMPDERLHHLAIGGSKHTSSVCHPN